LQGSAVEDGLEDLETPSLLETLFPEIRADEEFAGQRFPLIRERLAFQARSVTIVRCEGPTVKTRSFEKADR
jgi:hypothetical protein